MLDKIFVQASLVGKYNKREGQKIKYSIAGDKYKGRVIKAYKAGDWPNVYVVGYDVAIREDIR